MAWNIQKPFEPQICETFEGMTLWQGISVGELPDRGDTPDATMGASGDTHVTPNVDATNGEKFGTPGWFVATRKEKEPEHWKQASKALAGSLLAPVKTVVDLQWRTWCHSKLARWDRSQNLIKNLKNCEALRSSGCVTEDAELLLGTLRSSVAKKLRLALFIMETWSAACCVRWFELTVTQLAGSSVNKEMERIWKVAILKLLSLQAADNSDLERALVWALQDIDQLWVVVYLP